MWWAEEMSFWKCTAVILTAVPLAYEVVKYFYVSKTNADSHNQEENSEDSFDTNIKHEVLMFREDRYGCRFHCQRRFECEKPDCAYRHLSKICHLLGNAVKSLDVCVCFITSEDLIGSILMASQRGVRVRVITDGHMMQFGDQVTILERYGVPMYKVKSSCMMHHKFAVVDNKVVIEGSANWTIQAFSGNWENIIISSDASFVQAFSEIFSELWDSLQSDVS